MFELTTVVVIITSFSAASCRKVVKLM